MSLAQIVTCTDEELCAFSQRLDYFRLILDSRDALSDELLAAHLRHAAAARARADARGSAGGEFLVEAGRELARLLAGDLLRLDALLRRIRP
jgi:hypothetical protein